MALPMPPPGTLTYAQYRELPDDGLRYEMIDGELFVTAAPNRQHFRLARTLTHKIMLYLDDHPIGELYYAPYDVAWLPGSKRDKKEEWVQPDIFIVLNEHLDISTADNIQGAPDLVVEVLSTSNKRNMERDLVYKKKLYERRGVREYWIVYQDVLRVEIYRLQENGTYGNPQLAEAGGTLITPLLPGFSLSIDELYDKL